MEKFEITRRVNGEFQFTLKARNGEIILSSEGYLVKTGVKNCIQSVKDHCQSDENYDRKQSQNGEYYFTLLARNFQVIGVSERYKTITAREKGIAAVKDCAPKAIVEDCT